MSSKRFFEFPQGFRKLDVSLKIAYTWLWMNCDKAGYWQMDIDLFEFENPGIQWPGEELANALPGYIQISARGVLLLDFLRVEYGVLKHDYNPHKPAWRSIEKISLSLIQA